MQVLRRNLTAAKKNEYLGRLYNATKKKRGGDRKSRDHSGPLIKTAQIVASQTGTSPMTVKRAGKLADAIDKTGLQVDSGLTAGEIVAVAKIVPDAPTEQQIQQAVESVREVKDKHPVVAQGCSGEIEANRCR